MKGRPWVSRGQMGVCCMWLDNAAELDTLTASAFLNNHLFKPLPSLKKVWGYFIINTNPIKSSSRREKKGKIHIDVIHSGARGRIQQWGGGLKLAKATELDH